MQNEVKITYIFLRIYDIYHWNNDDRSFNGLVLYYLSRDYFYKYISLYLLSDSIWYMPYCLILMYHIISAIIFELALCINLGLMYLFFLHIISFILSFLNWHCISILTLYIYFDIIKIFSSLFLLGNKFL